MKLKELSLSDCEQVRQWRNRQMECLRTSFFLTEEQQKDFYYNVVCNRQTNARYWGIVMDDNKVLNKIPNGTRIPIIDTGLICMCGIENIQWENRLGEISLILNPEYTKDYFEEALSLILKQGFNYLNLENIYTEVYECNLYIDLWQEMDAKYNENTPFKLPNRKYCNGRFYDSTYINFNKEKYNENVNC